MKILHYHDLCILIESLINEKLFKNSGDLDIIKYH